MVIIFNVITNTKSLNKEYCCLNSIKEYLQHLLDRDFYIHIGMFSKWNLRHFYRYKSYIYIYRIITNGKAGIMHKVDPIILYRTFC